MTANLLVPRSAPLSHRIFRLTPNRGGSRIAYAPEFSTWTKLCPGTGLPQVAWSMPTSRLDRTVTLRDGRIYSCDTLTGPARPGPAGVVLLLSSTSVFCEACGGAAQWLRSVFISHDCPTFAHASGNGLFSASTPPARWPPRPRALAVLVEATRAHPISQPALRAAMPSPPRTCFDRKPAPSCQHLGSPRDFLKCGREPRLAAGRPPPGPSCL